MSRHVIYPERQPVEDGTITLSQLDAAVAFAVVRIRRMANDARVRIGGGLTPVDYPADQWPIIVSTKKDTNHGNE